METAHFSNIRHSILQQLDKAKKNIRVAVCWFTNQNLFDKLCEKINSDLTVELIIINDFINNREDGLDFQRFIDLGGHFYFGDSDKPMHNKYCIIDDNVLINGSYNWTYYAEGKNEENVIIHHQKDELTKQFTADFERIKSGLVKINKVAKHTLVEISDFNIFGTNNYLSQDYLYQAAETKNPSIVEKAFELSPNNIQIQKKAIEFNLKTKKKTKATIGETVDENGFAQVIPIGTEIPFIQRQNFTTVEDNQTICDITVKFGESPYGSANTLIGSFTIRGIPPMKARVPRLYTTYSIDLFGILTVSKHIGGTNNITTMKFDVKHLLTDIV